ncbi:MAG: ribose-phosphate pyrophosphokinase [Gammaproteobacteria bacterium]
MTRLVVFAGNANQHLAKSVTKHLGLPVGAATVERFSDGEIMVEITENVRGSDVFILQSTCMPTNDHLMELLVMADALRRASAGRITAVMPYFGYARQDRRVRSARVPITAKVVADMITTVGIDRVLTVDLHADQIQGFFDIPVDNIYATHVLLQDIEKSTLSNPMVVSPDVGGVVRARAFAKYLSYSDMAIIDKRRSTANESKVMHIIGDVTDRTCILIDDIVDTAGTLCNAAHALKNNGAKQVLAYATHPVLSGKAIDNICNSALDGLVITDTIPLSKISADCDKIRQISLAPLLAETVRRINNEESISAMFDPVDLH